MTTVLIVDDDAGISQTLESLLPWETCSASSIDLGLIVARQWQPSIVLLDVNFRFEKRSGLDMIAEFRRACPSAQIIVFTGMYHPEDCERARLAGAVSYLEKGDVSMLRRVLLAVHETAPSPSDRDVSFLH